jgi:hypothetical protein
MSADGSVELVWAEETRKFRIAIGEFRSLQESVNARRVAIGAEPVGPSSMLTALRTNNAWPDDVRDVLKAGLVGAGIEYDKAQRLLMRHFDNKPLLEHTKTAFLVLLAALVGVPDDESSKKKIAETVVAAEAPTLEQTSQSDSPSSTETAPQ